MPIHEFIGPVIGAGDASGGVSTEEILDPADFSGGRAGQAAAESAAAAQVQSTRIATEEQRAAREQARADLAPFAEAGAGQLGSLTSLINDPNAQRDFVSNNPFFKSLADDAQRRLFSNQAARGKIGSGGTSEALQNSLLLLGNDLLGKNINQRFNLATLGSNAAAGQATATLGAGNNISELAVGSGNAQAAGIIGANNAAQQGRSNMVSTGIAIGSIFASDRRIKENIKEIGSLNNGLSVYMFNYIGDDKMQMSVMAQDVQEVMPDAVMNINGVLHVNMEMISNG